MIKKQANAQGNHAKRKGKDAKPRPQAQPHMQNRELSWLAFNKRVLDQGEDRNVPVLERLTRVSIFSSNLQEFFMVRVGSLTDLSLIKQEIRDNKTLMTPTEQLDAIHETCHRLYPEQERIFGNILEQMAEHGIYQHTLDTLDDQQRDYLRLHLQSRVMPFLSPQVINARHPFPHLENGALYVLLRLDEKERRAKTKDEERTGKKKAKNMGADDATFGLIPLPRQAHRVITLPGTGTHYILLEEALKLIVEDVFSMYVCKRASVICVTRNADIDANEGVDEIDYDYREHMKRILKKRARLAPVRLETDTPLSAVTETFLLKHLALTDKQVYVTKVPLDMGYAWGLPDMVDPKVAAQLTPAPFDPAWPVCLDRDRSIIEQVCEEDKLLSYPYESMDPFIQMLREASVDPDVISIKITLYRLASQSHLAEALLAAADNGKEVTALFELRARFDEANNIDWSQRFEQAGANVIYGFHDFKVHSKICVITRNTEQGLQHITQLGTGNYNEKTSRLYTDFSFMTTDPDIGRDAAEFFRNMNLENTSDNYTTLAVAPLQIKPMILQKIDEQIALAQAGKPNGLLFKTNSITDKAIIDKIVEASQAGVRTKLFVRGISCIVPGVEGFTDNVEVVSIVGRLLEHSRIYGFGCGQDMEIYLSSADLMTRNMDKRIEIAWPLRMPAIKQRVLDYLTTCLSDTAKLRMLRNDLSYTPLEFFAQKDPDTGKLESFDSQEYLIEKAAEDYQEHVLEKEREAAQRSVIARTQRMREAQVAADRAAEQAADQAADQAAEQMTGQVASAEDTRIAMDEHVVAALPEEVTAAHATEEAAPRTPAQTMEQEHEAQDAAREDAFDEAQDAAHEDERAEDQVAPEPVALDGDKIAEAIIADASLREQAIELAAQRLAEQMKSDAYAAVMSQDEERSIERDEGEAAQTADDTDDTPSPVEATVIDEGIVPVAKEGAGLQALNTILPKTTLFQRLKFLFTGKF